MKLVIILMRCLYTNLERGIRKNWGVSLSSGSSTFFIVLDAVFTLQKKIDHLHVFEISQSQITHRMHQIR